MEPQFEILQTLLPIRKSKTGKDVTPSARALYNYLEVKTPFTTWLARRVEEYGFVEGKDFLTILEESTGGRPESDAALTVDMAKELGMVEKTTNGRTVRQYFIWAENKLKELATAPPAQLPTDFATALRLLADSVEEKARMQHQIEEMEPKAAFTDAVSVSTGCIPMSAVAKYLKIPNVGRTKLFRMLREDRVLQGNNEPYASQIASGHFEVQLQAFEVGSKGKRTAGTTRCTPKGLIYLAKKYKQTA